MYLCFFKQKTAYDMRISDWSSDGCSSDLAAVKLERAIDHRGAGIGGEALGHRGEFGLVGRVGGHLGRGDVEQGARRLDRKSVVQGKSVLVRVGLGGIRIIKK